MVVRNRSALGNNLDNGVIASSNMMLLSVTDTDSKNDNSIMVSQKNHIHKETCASTSTHTATLKQANAFTSSTQSQSQPQYHSQSQSQSQVPTGNYNVNSTAADTGIDPGQLDPAVAKDLNERVHVRYHGKWYDMTNWRNAHPAGSHWIDWFNQRDATDIIDGLHDKRARKMVDKLPKTKGPTAAVLELKAAPDSKIQMAFRELYNQLEKDGWWERDMAFEYKQLGIWGSLVIAAIATRNVSPFWSMVFLALSFTGSGWISHDYVHGLDPFARSLRAWPTYACGLCPRWWSDKHNKHHALTNEMGVDEDMDAAPLLYTWAPDPSQDSPFRKIQHWVFWIPFSVLFFLWRIDSIRVGIKAYRQGRPYAKSELRGLIVHYFWLLSIFNWRILIPALFLSGLTTAFVVTSTHQSEEKFPDFISDHILRQFLCTRSVVMTNPFSAWIWGGMQYQIEHHLFPSIPRSKLPALRLVLKKFAEDNNVPGGYRESGEFEILKMNWDTYRRIAHADPLPGAPLTRGRYGQQAAIEPPPAPFSEVVKAPFNEVLKVAS